MMNEQKIVPNLWFNHTAREAVDWYIDAFGGDSRIIETAYYPETSDEGLADFQHELAGDVLSIDFQLGDLRMGAINAGNEFRPNPSISLMVNFDPSRDEAARERMDSLWAKLNDGGTVRMPLDAYDFSTHYGWVEDKYGVNWQLILTDPDGEPRPFIIPSLMFTGPVLGKADAAREYYAGVFEGSKLGDVYRYEETNEMFVEGQIMWSELQLAGQWFVINDGGPQQNFTFNEGVSLVVMCEDQAEIDYYWEKLSARREFEQCGWCKDKFGVSWQVVPKDVNELMKTPGAFKTMMQQKKIELSAYES